MKAGYSNTNIMHASDTHDMCAHSVCLLGCILAPVKSQTPTSDWEWCSGVRVGSSIVSDSIGILGLRKGTRIQHHSNGTYIPSIHAVCLKSPGFWAEFWLSSQIYDILFYSTHTVPVPTIVPQIFPVPF